MKPQIREWPPTRQDHVSLDWPAGSHLMAWCGDPHVDHGRKHDLGGEAITRGT